MMQLAGDFIIMMLKTLVLPSDAFLISLHSSTFSCSSEYEFAYVDTAYQIVGWIEHCTGTGLDNPVYMSRKITELISNFELSDNDGLVTVNGLIEWYMSIYNYCVMNNIVGRLNPLQWWGNNIIVEIHP